MSSYSSPSPCSTPSYLPCDTPSDSPSLTSSLSLSDLSSLSSVSDLSLPSPRAVAVTWASPPNCLGLLGCTDPDCPSLSLRGPKGSELPCLDPDLDHVESPPEKGQKIKTNDRQAEEEVEDPLLRSMGRLPAELVSQILSLLIADPAPSIRLANLHLSRAVYTKLIPSLYANVVLTHANAESYFYGLGPPFRGPPPPPVWPVSGPGLTPLHALGLSVDPSVSPFIRKFTQCNLVRNLTISDLGAFTTVLRATSQAWVSGMDTWRSRLLFDQIDTLTLLPGMFEQLDSNPLGVRGMLGEVWNAVKADVVNLYFPVKGMKKEAYEYALSALGGPSSIGQRDRLLGDVLLHLAAEGLEGVHLGYIAASRVTLHLYSEGLRADGDGDGESEGQGARNLQGERSVSDLSEGQEGETVRKGVLVQQWLKRNLTDTTPGHLYMPPGLERVEIHGLPSALLTTDRTDLNEQAGAEARRDTIPRLIRETFEGELAGQVAQAVRLFESDAAAAAEERCVCCGM